MTKLLLQRLPVALLLIVCLATWLQEAHAHLPFSLHKLESGQPGYTMLVVGGIQGDEPGGFNAASLLVSHYKITKGNVWVVPNLNFISMIKRTRGVYGDMNRKFSTLEPNDPEYETILRIKAILTDPQVDIILNLHDGSGFYRHDYLDSMRNPLRWGQSIIIDQEVVPGMRFGYLGPIARQVVENVNSGLYHEEHSYHVKDTQTRLGDTEMAKTLTYFAINNEKAAFGLEASKSFPTHLRTYYHLRALEAFMNVLGIEFERRFSLTAEGVKDAIDDNITLAFYDDRILLDLRNPRGVLQYFPLKKGSSISVKPNRPILAVVDAGKGYSVYYGNRNLTKLSPQYFEYDETRQSIALEVDGRCQQVPFGRIVPVLDTFKVMSMEGFRVNVIGFTHPGVADEADLIIRHKDIPRRFSVDQEGTLFRVEVYRHDKFSGMVLVDFSGHQRQLASAGE